MTTENFLRVPSAARFPEPQPIVMWEARELGIHCLGICQKKTHMEIRVALALTLAKLHSIHHSATYSLRNLAKITQPF